MTALRDRARSAIRRVVIVVAGLASIATSPAGWVLRAPLPPDARAPQQGARVVVEASQPPNVVAQRRSDRHSLSLRREQEAEPKSERGVYFLPPGFDLSPVTIDGRNCGEGGGMCSACQPPAGSFVRVVSVEPVAAWAMTARSQELTVHVNYGESARFVVTVEASRDVDLEAVAIDGSRDARATGFSWGPQRDASGRRRATTSWFRLEGALDAAALDIRWVVVATVSGYCVGTTECHPPQGEAVRIVGVEPKLD